jgi:NDP-sugar pyrophosphorylase family protein
MVSGFTGAILAAGRGERLRPASGALPKPLVSIFGETLLARQARCMLEVGAKRVLAIINSETAAKIEQCGMWMPAELQLLVRDTPNSLESLLALSEHLPAGRFALATVDAAIEQDEFASFITRAMELTASSGVYHLDGALGLVRWRGDKHPLFVELAPDGLIRRFGVHRAELVTAGVYVFSTSIFRYAARARSEGLDAMRRYLAMLAEAGTRLAGIVLRQAVDIDEVDDLEAARQLLGPCVK